MGMNTLSQSGHTTYGIKEFVVDSESDVENLPTDVPMGSAALVIETGAVYVLNSKKSWKKLSG